MKMMSTIAAIVICLGLATGAQAADSLKVKPFTFADTQGDFGPPVDPDVVSAKWVNKRGTTSTPTTNGAPGDFGLVLTKNTATTTVAASGAIVKGPEGDVVTATTEFDSGDVDGSRGRVVDEKDLDARQFCLPGQHPSNHSCSADDWEHDRIGGDRLR